MTTLRYVAALYDIYGNLPALDAVLAASLPALVALSIEGLGEVLFCHGTARKRRGTRHRGHARRDRLERILDEAGTSVLVGGHTHRRFDRRINGRRVINAGRVGRPYERASADPVAPESLIDPAESPLARRGA